VLRTAWLWCVSPWWRLFDGAQSENICNLLWHFHSSISRWGCGEPNEPLNTDIDSNTGGRRAINESRTQSINSTVESRLPVCNPSLFRPIPTPPPYSTTFYIGYRWSKRMPSYLVDSWRGGRPDTSFGERVIFNCLFFTTMSYLLQCHIHYNVLFNTRPYILQCPIYYNVIFTTMSYLLPCHIYYNVIFTTMSYLLQCHIYYNVIFITMSYLLQCHIYYNVIFTTMSYLLQCHIYYHVIFTTMSYLLKCHI